MSRSCCSAVWKLDTPPRLVEIHNVTAVASLVRGTEVGAGVVGAGVGGAGVGAGVGAEVGRGVGGVDVVVGGADVGDGRGGAGVDVVTGAFVGGAGVVAVTENRVGVVRNGRVVVGPVVGIGCSVVDVG